MAAFDWTVVEGEILTEFQELVDSIVQTNKKLWDLELNFVRVAQETGTEALKAGVEELVNGREVIVSDLRRMMLNFCDPVNIGFLDHLSDHELTERVLDELRRMPADQVEDLAAVVAVLKSQDKETNNKIDELTAEFGLPIDGRLYFLGIDNEKPLEEIFNRMYGHGEEWAKTYVGWFENQKQFNEIEPLLNLEKTRKGFSFLRKEIVSGQGQRNTQNEELRILMAMEDWVFSLDLRMFKFFRSLKNIVPLNSAAVWNMNWFCILLRELRDGNNGMVPIAVHKMIELLESPYKAGPETGLEDDFLFRELEIESMIERLHEIVLRLRFVQRGSGMPNARRINAEVVEICGEALDRSEMQLREMEEELNRSPIGGLFS